MKILVTGASGFVGNHVLNYLVENTEHDIIATSRSKISVLQKSWFTKVKFIEADLYENRDNWFEYFQHPDILIHLAWANLPNYTQSFHLTENLPKEIIFLENIISNGLKCLSVTGTCFEYGMQQGELSEEMPTFPENPYAIAKDSLRRYLEFKTKSLEVNFKWFRLFYMYGEGQNPNALIPQLENALEHREKLFNMSPGDQIRDYLPVAKVAEYIVKLSLKQECKGIFNIASGNPVRLLDFIKEFVKSKGKEIDLNLGFYSYSILEPKEFWGCSKKVNSLM